MVIVVNLCVDIRPFAFSIFLGGGVKKVREGSDMGSKVLESMRSF